VEGKGETPDRQAGKGGAAAVLVRRILEEQYQDYGWQMDTLKVGHLDNFRSKTERYVNYLRKRNDIDALLVLLDLDDGCAAQVAQQVTEGLRKLNPPKPIAVVFAVREYEAWFLAAANSLWGRPYQDNPESIRDAKGELRRLFLEDYAPTTDQASLSARRRPPCGPPWSSASRIFRSSMSCSIGTSTPMWKSCPFRHRWRNMELRGNTH